MARCHAQLVYEDAERAFTELSKSLMTNAQNPREWCPGWSTVTTTVFGASFSLPPFVNREVS